jgi:hypothetical protein
MLSSESSPLLLLALVRGSDLPTTLPGPYLELVFSLVGRGVSGDSAWMRACGDQTAPWCGDPLATGLPGRHSLGRALAGLHEEWAPGPEARALDKW